MVRLFCQSTTMTTIVHDTTEAVCLSAEYNLYLKPIAKMTISVALPQLKLPGKSISNWEVMERVKAMVAPEQFSALRISKSTMDFIRFEGEVENKLVVKNLLSCLDGRTIKLSGFTDVLKVRAVENKVDFPTRYDWDSFFRDAKDMNETLPGERPDTIHLEGLPCRWFSQKDSQYPDRPSEEVLIAVFQTFGKVVFDTTKHLSELAIKKRSLERMKLQELERQREEQKRREKEEEERRKEEERKQKEQEEGEKERRREEKLRKREQRLREREERRNLKRVRRQQEEEQKKLQMKIAMEERRLLLAQRNLESIRLVAELLARAKAMKQKQQEKERAEREEHERQERVRQKEELARLQHLEACRRKQEEELRRVEVEKERALELQRREKELRERLVCNLLKKSNERPTKSPGTRDLDVTTEQASDHCDSDGMLGGLDQVNGMKPAESKQKQVSNSSLNSQVSGKKGATEDRRKIEERKKNREGKREEVVRSRERTREQEHSHRERRSYSRERKRRSTSYSKRRGSSSRHRRSYSHHGSRRRSHSHCSSSSSRDRSRSASGTSYSRGRSRSHSHRRHSRGSSRGSNKSGDRSYSHYSRRYKRRSSRDRSHSRRR
ncbi:A-kinase anchor protein 17A isoform X3 [Channa argus]|uniref:A-kinase anchor protein 17A isoform X3 n=1 Tax=Channa argus TaxID=215402 RepID=UPI0035219E55